MAQSVAVDWLASILYTASFSLLITVPVYLFTRHVIVPIVANHLLRIDWSIFLNAVADLPDDENDSSDFNNDFSTPRSLALIDVDHQLLPMTAGFEVEAITVEV